MNGKFVSYIRVSTQKQGKSGLGLQAQRDAIADYLNGGCWKLVEQYVEVESGKKNDRPQLKDALSMCRLHRATLLVAKLDRLARNVAFISALMEAGVDFVAVDLPEANKLTVHIMAAMAEYEAKMCSIRTKAGLAVAKRKGTVLGGRRVTEDRWGQIAAKGRKAGTKQRIVMSSAWAADVFPVIKDIRKRLESTKRKESEPTLREIATELNVRGIEARRGGEWSAVQVKRVLESLES